jgi:hypothetical protein
VQVIVQRAFLTGGAIQEVGKRLDLPDRDARELIATGKCEAAQPLPAQAGPMTTDTTPGLVLGKKGKSNAGQ